MTAPATVPGLHQAPTTHSRLLAWVREVAELHRFHDAIHDHGGTEPGTQPEEEHLTMLVASQCLHGGIVDYLNWTLECSSKIESGPPASKVIRIRNGPIPDDYPGIANRYRVILPILGKLLDASDHLFRG